jgi:cell division protein FtsL
VSFNERLKKIGIIAAVALLPLLFCANVWQSFRYSSLKKEIARLESIQQDLIEQNKRNILGISVLESPERIEALAREKLGLGRPSPEDFIIVRPETAERESDG